MSSTSSSTATMLGLWGRIVIHNKLLTQEQWDECVKLHGKLGGSVGIDQILLDRKLLSDKHVAAIKKKVSDVIDKSKAGDGAAGQTESHAPTPAAAPAPSHAPAPAPAPVAAPRAAHAEAPKDPAPSADGDLMPLVDDANAPKADGPGAPGWRPSDAEWVEGSDAAVDHKTRGEVYKDEERIAIEGDPAGSDAAAPTAGAAASGSATPGAAAPGASKVKIKVDNVAPLKPAYSGPKLRGGPKLPGVRATSAAPAGGEAAEDDQSRIESGVVPNDRDADSMAILAEGIQRGASDVHLASGSPPFFRLYGQLVMTDRPILTPEAARRMVLGFMNDEQQQHYLRHHDLDFSFEDPNLGRFRVNALEQFRGPDIIFRCIPSAVPTLADLGLPEALAKFTEYHQGLVLVTGPAGSGKTTTASALINLVNQSRSDHVITVEDPVEFLHISAGCNVTQRQVPIHTKSFASALKAALREDPDVIMIGEMRDLETVSLAIRAAETGHLVIGTLQTKSAARTIDRVIDVFPTDQQAQIRTMLAESLRGVISQQLIPRADGNGRVVAIEVLTVINAVANLIRDSKTFQLPSLMQTGKKTGQKMMDDSLTELLNQGIITHAEALKACENPKLFKKEDPIGEIKLKK